MAELIPQSYEVIPIDSVTLWPRNPNEGDVGAIGESIAENDFYGACVVQKSTGHILVGNHRWMAAKQSGLVEIPVFYVDVDDERAMRIALADKPGFGPFNH
jgi:ParB-like chromosome segregation protein Spo0J